MRLASKILSNRVRWRPFKLKCENWTEEVFKCTVLTVVYSWHNPCPWCSRLTPIFAEIAEEFRGKIRFFKLNVLENPAN